ncbi:MAG: hypothetical protein AAGI15_17920 [Pseudomonadota bacterium]
MKIVKILIILAVVYVGVVVLFESLLGYFQPASADTMVIATQSEAGDWSERVLARIEHNGELYAAVNHWPRAWYRAALERPQVRITHGGETRSYTAVLLEGADYDRVNGARPLPLGFRILTGFPPRRLFRLQPIDAETAS